MKHRTVSKCPIMGGIFEELDLKLFQLRMLDTKSSVLGHTGSKTIRKLPFFSREVGNRLSDAYHNACTICVSVNIYFYWGVHPNDS